MGDSRIERDIATRLLEKLGCRLRPEQDEKVVERVKERPVDLFYMG